MDSRLTKIFESLSSQKPELADAIIFLQGDRLDRAPKVLELYRAGYAPLIVITGNNAMMKRRRVNQENDIRLDELLKHLRQTGVPDEKMLVDDRAMNTKDQAVNIIKLARDKNWQKMILVTSPYHLLRAYLTFVKQIANQDWSGKIIMQTIKAEWQAVPSGRKKTAKQMLAEELEKIQLYKKDIASPEQGLNYLKN